MSLAMLDHGYCVGRGETNIPIYLPMHPSTYVQRVPPHFFTVGGQSTPFQWKPPSWHTTQYANERCVSCKTDQPGIGIEGLSKCLNQAQDIGLLSPAVLDMIHITKIGVGISSRERLLDEFLRKFVDVFFSTYSRHDDSGLGSHT